MFRSLSFSLSRLNCLKLVENMDKKKVVWRKRDDKIKNPEFITYISQKYYKYFEKKTNWTIQYCNMYIYSLNTSCYHFNISMNCFQMNDYLFTEWICQNLVEHQTQKFMIISFIKSIDRNYCWVKENKKMDFFFFCKQLRLLCLKCLNSKQIRAEQSEALNK